MDSDDEMSVDLKHDILLGFNLFKNEKNQISSIFGVGYSNFANNANNCKYNLYFNEKINIYFTTRLTKTILERNLKPYDARSIV